MAAKSGDTAHLYDGKTVRSSAPSRKKLAAKGNASGDIPKDAIPTVEQVFKILCKILLPHFFFFKFILPTFPYLVCS